MQRLADSGPWLQVGTLANSCIPLRALPSPRTETAQALQERLQERLLGCQLQPLASTTTVEQQGAAQQLLKTHGQHFVRQQPGLILLC